MVPLGKGNNSLGDDYMLMWVCLPLEFLIISVSSLVANCILLILGICVFEMANCSGL